MTGPDTDVAAESRPTLRLTRQINASREAVFKAWTDPEALSTWFGPEGIMTRNVSVDPRPGGEFSPEMHEPDHVYPVSGTYREVRPPERLVFSRIWGHGELNGLETTVTIELRERDGGTELILLHGGLPTPTAIEEHEGGWIGCFNCLEQYLSGTTA